MHLTYDNKKPEADILGGGEKASLVPISDVASTNKLILGENLAVLRSLLREFRGRVDLIYIDPPFATNAEYKIGVDRTNTISSSNSDELAYSDSMVGAEYLEFIRERLILLRELLSDKGSIYVHIDFKIGHYLKVLMDEIFGRKHFRNDIARVKCNPKNFQRKSYGNIKDLILFYSKSDSITWNYPKEPLSIDDKARLFRKTDKDGRLYTTIPLHAPGETSNGVTGQMWRGMKPPKGRHWRSAPEKLEALDKQGLVEWSANGVPRKKIYADESSGKRVQDIWTFKDPQHPVYPTQKSSKLLEFIVKASSREGDLVLDCFCGSGTTLLAAQTLNRKWIGIDNSEAAISVAQEQLAPVSHDLFSQHGYEFLIERRRIPELSREFTNSTVTMT